GPDEFVRLEKIAKRSTEKEIAASEAERESRKLKQVEYMSDKIGREFEGVITGVTEWGIYIAEKETGAEGMAKLRDITGDFWKLDEKNYAIIGEKTKKKYALGDSVKFKVVGTDVERKAMDYKIV
ncbi:MAG: S1 RNA-binding domain-containing protein, partial [bacterium]|nr:S1 RNA-binding domain-containing protein [bacterium]